MLKLFLGRPERQLVNHAMREGHTVGSTQANLYNPKNHVLNEHMSENKAERKNMQMGYFLHGKPLIQNRSIRDL
jgi:hypothetical protein